MPVEKVERKDFIDEMVNLIIEQYEDLPEEKVELKEIVASTINENAEDTGIDLELMGIKNETQFNKLVSEVITKLVTKMKTVQQELMQKLEERKEELMKYSWSFICKGKVMKHLIKAVLSVNNEFKLNVLKDGLHTQLVDPAHVYMVDLNISKKNFCTGNDCINKKFDYHVNEAFEICFDAEELHRDFFRLISNWDDVTGLFKDGILTLKSDRLSKEFTPIDTTQPEAKIPDLTLKATLDVSSFEITALKKAIDGQEIVQFITGKQGSKANIYQSSTDDHPLVFSINNASEKECKSMYSCDIMKTILDGVISVMNNIEMHLDTDSPIKITGKFLDGGDITVLLAPRIESE